MTRRNLTGVGRGSTGGAAALLATIVSYWKLDEASGTRVDDPGTNDLADNNTVTQAVGKLVNAAQFTAANSEFLSIASNPTLQLATGDWTWAGWAYADTLPGTAALISKRQAGCDYEIKLNVGGTQFNFNRSDVTNYSFGPALSTATWYFVCCRYDSVAGQYAFSVNAAAPTTQVAAALSSTGSTFTMGAGTNGTVSFWDGRLDGWGLWKSAGGGGGYLSDAQVTFLYNAGTGLDYPFS